MFTDGYDALHINAACMGVFSLVNHLYVHRFSEIHHQRALLVSPLCFSIFVSFVLEAFYVEYSVDKGDLQTSLERRIEELELAVAQCVDMT